MLASDQLPDAKTTDPIVFSPRAYGVLKNRLDKLARWVVNWPLQISETPTGYSLNFVAPIQKGFYITGTLTMGGAYTASEVYPLSGAINSGNAILGTSSFGFINTGTTATILNTCELTGSIHTVSVNSFVMCDSARNVDGAGGFAKELWQFTSPLPPTLPVTLVRNGGTDGTAPAGSLATFSTLTYNAIYGGMTLVAAGTLSWGSTEAGPVTVFASKGFAQLNTGTNVYDTILTGNEKFGAVVCS